jgi:ferredoxin
MAEPGVADGGTIAGMTALTITLQPSGWSFPADPDTTVLHAAERAGIDLPSSCRNGTCRTCICRLARGSVRYLVEWPGLSLDEKREGYILPCVAVALEDLAVDQRLAKRIVFPD